MGIALADCIQTVFAFVARFDNVHELSETVI